MPRKPTGNVYESRGRWYARVRVHGERVNVALNSTAKADADERLPVLAGLARQLHDAGAAVPLDASRALLVRAGQATTPGAIEAVRRVIAKLCSGAACAKPAPPGPPPTTYREVVKMWCSGEIARRYPDRVRHRLTIRKDRTYQERYVLPEIGDVPVVELTLDDFERVLQRIPSHLQAGTRRGIAKSLARAMTLAHFPLRLIPAALIPRGWLPRKPDDKAHAWLYPKEEAQVLACTAIPLRRRIYYGFLAREGMRSTEARVLRWREVDLDVEALTLDANKTDDPRAWALSPGVAPALAAWREYQRARGVPVGPDDRVFEFRSRVPATEFRKHARLAGLDRPELYEHGPTRLQLRLHDLRGTFVTISLACGQTETWVMDRMGHRSHSMIQLYRRAARMAAELALGPLRPMVEAIPEFRPDAPMGGGLGAASGADPSALPVSPRNYVANRRRRAASKFLPKGDMPDDAPCVSPSVPPSCPDRAPPRSAPQAPPG